MMGEVRVVGVCQREHGVGRDEEANWEAWVDKVL